MSIDPATLFIDDDKFLIVLDSRNSTNIDNSPYNSSVNFAFQDTILFPRSALKKSCSLLTFSMPNSIYNINETNSFLNLLFMDNLINGVPVSFNYQIPYGNYTATTLIAAITSYYNAVEPPYPWVGTDAQNTYYYSVGYLGGLSMTLNPLNNTFVFGSNGCEFALGPQTTMDYVLGINKNTTQLCAGNDPSNPYLYTLYCPYTCNFNGIQNLNIHLETFNSNNVASINKGRSSIIQSISIDPNATQITFNKTHDFEFGVNQDSIDNLQISIKDDLGNFVNLNNQHWNMTLLFSVKTNKPRFHDEFSRIMEYGYG